MFVKRLILQNYRNYKHLEIQFPLKRIYITGQNGIGKTNILEAIHYLTIGRSFRKAEDHDLIRKGMDEASIYLEFHTEMDNRDHTLSCLISNGRKAFAFDNEKVRSLSAILGKVTAVYYDPSLVFFFKSEPEQRRKLLDEVCSQISSQYLFAIGRYKKLLKERNTALQQDYDQDVIDAYRNQLMNLSYRIVKDRKDTIRILSGKAENYYQRLFGEEHSFHLSYKTCCPIDDDQESFLKNSLASFEKSKSLENIRKTTLIGPHRDDLLGQLDGYDLSSYGSQGENRIASLSLKLSIMDLLYERLGARPLLLLDDITSDLDEKRCQNLLSCINQEDQQVFITGTRIPDGFSDYQVYMADGTTLQKGVEHHE
jgi:DNA replication and repair protein RecF